MRYCVIGSGGREHAIAWRLLHDGSAREVYVVPGNGGIEQRYRVHLSVDDFEGIHSFCMRKKIDCVVVGPEAPLAAGIVDFLDDKKISVFGPSGAAAMLEGSKLFAKHIMEKYGIPTARYREIRGGNEMIRYIRESASYPMVIKLDGLAAGKGVGIPENEKEALAFVDGVVKEGSRVFVEDYVEGEEASVLGISDGRTVLPMVAAQDHKRIGEGDKGPNTGGMGAYAPAPVVTTDTLERVKREILEPAVRGMSQEGTPFKGILYAGIILSGDEIKVLEFNVRFGDPETQAILPLLENRLGDLIQACVTGSLKDHQLTFYNRHAMTVVIASAGYPGGYEKGKIIRGLDAVGDEALVFHAGTEYSGGSCVTAGGRVLNVTATGVTLGEARDKAYSAVGKISFEGAYYRRDIGYRALASSQ